MTGKTQTPEQIAEQLAEAETQAQRLRAKSDAIAQAEQDARRAAELRLYRDAYTRSAAYRKARDKAKEKLDAIAAATPFDETALRAQFAELKRLDAHCGALRVHATQLDAVDPLPPAPNGASTRRPPQCAELFKDLTLSRYLDSVHISRTDAHRAQHLTELQTDVAAKVKAEVTAARAAAAAAADGDRLNVETPTPIAELHAAAIANIDPANFDPEHIRSAGLHRVQANAERDALEQLVQQGN